MRSAALGTALGATLLLSGSAADADGAAIEARIACAPDAAARIEAAVDSPERPIRWTPVARIDLATVLLRTGEGPSARLWIDCTRPDRLRLMFADRASERFLVRDVPLGRGLDEIALETIAQVIDGSLPALDSDAATGMTRTQIASTLEPSGAAPPEAPSPPSSSTATRAATAGEPRRDEAGAAHDRPRLEGEIGAFYGVEAFGPGPVVQHGPGLQGALGGRRGRTRVGAWAAAEYAVPETIATSLISARLEGAVLRGGVEVTHALTPRVAAGARAAIGGDVLRVSPRQGSGELTAQLAPDHVAWSPVAQAAVTVRVTVAPDLALSGALLADADLAVRHYDVAVDGVARRAFTPWPVRPGLAAGITWP